MFLDFIALLLLIGTLYLVFRLGREMEEMQRQIDEIKRATMQQEELDRKIDVMKSKIDELHTEIVEM